MKDKYVQSPAEARRVTQVRKGYVKEFSPRLIKWAGLSPASTIVDVPCGTGEMSRSIHDAGIGSQFYLVDVNQQMLETARAAMPVEKTVFVQADAADIGRVIPARVDAILALNGFHVYFEEKERFLRGAGARLRNNGRLVFDVSTVNTDADSQRFLNELDRQMVEMATELNTEIALPVRPDRALLDRYAVMIGENGLRPQDAIYLRSAKPVEQYTHENLEIPGRLRAIFPKLEDDEQIKDIFESASSNAVVSTGVETLGHTRVFYVASKGERS